MWKNTSQKLRLSTILVLGVILKMSIDNRQLGGYVSYFQAPNIIHCSPIESVQLTHYHPWEREVFSLWRFKEIQDAIYPLGHTEINIKCHQLGLALHQVTCAAKDFLYLERISALMKLDACAIEISVQSDSMTKIIPKKINVRSYAMHSKDIMFEYIQNSIKEVPNQVLECQ